MTNLDTKKSAQLDDVNYFKANPKIHYRIRENCEGEANAPAGTLALLINRRCYQYGRGVVADLSLLSENLNQQEMHDLWRAMKVYLADLETQHYENEIQPFRSWADSILHMSKHHDQ